MEETENNTSSPVPSSGIQNFYYPNHEGSGSEIQDLLQKLGSWSEQRRASQNQLDNLLSSYHGRVDKGMGALVEELRDLKVQLSVNDKDYNTEAPTQQNLLCQEQSPLRLIKSGLISESEKSDVMAVVGRSPIVEYVISQKTRHLLVLDRSQQSKHVWKHLRNALYRYRVTSQSHSVLLLDIRIELAISRNVIRGLSQ